MVKDRSAAVEAEAAERATTEVVEEDVGAGVIG